MRVKMNKYLLFVIFIMVMGFASSFDNIGTYKANTDLNLNLGCSYNNTYCASTFDCNITIYNTNGIVINNKVMSETFFPQFNYTIPASNLSKTGLYYGRQVCCSSSDCDDYSFEFEVNAQGKEYGTIQGSIYIIMVLLLCGIFGFTLYAFIKIPFGNERTSEGNIYKINWKKYLKLFMFGISYVCFIGIFYFAWNISYGILEFEEMAGLFNFIYRTAYILIFPLMVFIFVITLINFVHDKKLEQLIERGLSVKI